VTDPITTAVAIAFGLAVIGACFWTMVLPDPDDDCPHSKPENWGK
jgi:hypothetical protein